MASNHPGRGSPTLQARLDRLTEHAEQISRRLVSLRTSYCVLEPMIFDPALSQAYRDRQARRGYEFFREGAFLLVLMRVSLLLDDSGSRTPCIAKLMTALEDQPLVDALRFRFVERAPAGASPATDALSRFDRHLARAQATWERLGRSSLSDALRSTRDNLVAHDEFALPPRNDLKPLPHADLKRGLFKGLMPELISIVADLDAVYRATEWDEAALLDEVREAASAYWAVTVPPRS